MRVHRYFRANNTGYMVLNFEEGGSFKSWLKGLKRAPRQAELDRMVAPLLDALEIIHDADFLHRDIAPDNIMVRKDGSPVLIDFGSARGAIASQSRTVSALVKPGYSPYEQYATSGANQGPWTDIYALGATLYHAITGKRPPDAPSRVVKDEYVSAREAALGSYRERLPRRHRQGAEDRDRRAAAAHRRMARRPARARPDAQAGAASGQRQPARPHARPAAEGRGGSVGRRVPPWHGVGCPAAGLGAGEPRAGTARCAAAQGPASRLHRGAQATPLRLPAEGVERTAAAPGPKKKLTAKATGEEAAGGQRRRRRRKARLPRMRRVRSPAAPVAAPEPAAAAPAAAQSRLQRPARRSRRRAAGAGSGSCPRADGASA